MANVRINKETGNLEIRYQRKPSQTTRDALHAAGFKWKASEELWWGSATNDRVAVAVRVDPDFRPRATGRGKSMQGLPGTPQAKANGTKAAGAKARPMRFPEGVMTEAEWVRNHADRVEEVRESWLNHFDRTKFNRMDNAEQARYEADLKKKAEQPVYRAWKGDKFYAVSRASYETRASAKANGPKTAARAAKRSALTARDIANVRETAKRLREGYDRGEEDSLSETVMLSTGYANVELYPDDEASAYVVRQGYPTAAVSMDGGQRRKGAKRNGLVYTVPAASLWRGVETHTIRLVISWPGADLGRYRDGVDVGDWVRRNVSLPDGVYVASMGPARLGDGEGVIAIELRRVGVQQKREGAARDVRAELAPGAARRGAKANGMAEDFDRAVPRLQAPTAPVSAWNTVALGDEVEFRPRAAGSNTVRGIARRVDRDAMGPVVKLRGTRVLIHGRWQNGSSALDSIERRPRDGALVLIERADAKGNGNLEALRDLQTAGRRKAGAGRAPAKATTKRAAQATSPAKRKASAKPAPTNYRVSGDDAADLTFFDAMKRARAIVAEVGDQARRYNRGTLYVYNRGTKAKVGAWQVGADGRFHPVKK